MQGKPVTRVPQAHDGIWLNIKPFVVAGISGCFGQIATQPLDTIRVRQQIVSEQNGITKTSKVSVKLADVAKLIYKQSGYQGFWAGFGAGIIRQLIQNGIRLGVYRYCSDEHKRRTQRTLTYVEKSGLALIAGWTSVIIGNPPDVVIVRCQTDTLLPPEKRRNYKSAFSALYRIVREEGVPSLWRGCFPSIMRAGFVNLGMIAPYEELKERLNAWTGTVDTLQTRLIASALAGCMCAFISLPSDNIKTKLQSMKADQNKVLPYKGFFDCVYKTVQREGILRLWVGLGTFIGRAAPYSMITLMIQDFFFILSQKYGI